MLGEILELTQKHKIITIQVPILATKISSSSKNLNVTSNNDT